MLQSIRDKFSTGALAWFVLVLVGFIFILWGFGEFFSASKMSKQNQGNQQRSYLAYALQNHGMLATEPELIKAILSQEAFKVDGKFSKQTYRDVLKANKFTEESFS